MNIDIKELKELLALLDEDGVDGFMYVVFRGKDSASIREFGNIYPQNVQIHLRTQNQDGAKVVLELEKEKEELKSSPFDSADDSTNVSKNSITQPYAYAVVQGEDGKENVSLQFDHPEMCGQEYKQAIPLFTTPQNQLEKKSKPVAWMMKYRNKKISLSFDKFQLEEDNTNYFNIPLYTTPQTKPLSDEEINEIKTLMEINYGCVPPLEFAWAIEERHGIK